MGHNRLSYRVLIYYIKKIRKTNVRPRPCEILTMHRISATYYKYLWRAREVIRGTYLLNIGTHIINTFLSRYSVELN